MSGHVFHPGHSELHGVTVVLETTGETMYIGRYHEETPAGVLLHNVAEYRPVSTGPSPREFVERTLKYGVRADREHVVVPSPEVRSITRLMDWADRPTAR
jgi:hypothetical protein